jgi:hypothetical protein
MPLIDLKTDLKSLRYGKDRPGGGSSPEPYIQVTPQNSFNLPTEEIGTNGGKDWVLRGGTLTLSRSAEDVSRLLKWGTKDSLNSVIFTAKQASLSALGQRWGAGGPTEGVQGEGVYLPTSTLAQVGVNAFGIHGNKQGVNPFPFDASFTVFGRQINFNLGNTGGRPTYVNSYIYDSTKPAIEPEFNRLVYLAAKNANNTTGILAKYPGGPGAIGGILGNTTFKFSSDSRTGDANPLRITSPTKFYGTYKPAYTPGKYLKLVGTPKNPGASGEYLRLADDKLTNPFNKEGQYLLQNNVYTQGNTFPDMFEPTAFPQKSGVATFTQKQLIEKTPISKGGQISDFRKQITVNRAIAKMNGMLIDAPNYQNQNIDKRLNYFDPGSKSRNRNSYTQGSGIVDAINGLYMYYDKSVNTTGGITNDLVKFRFAVIDPDNPSSKTFVHFRSFFNGAITDNISSNWDSYRYQGRGEEFFHYGGFSREIGFGFVVPAQSKEELSIMYQKLNYLQSVMAPNYSGAGYMRGNIIQLTIGGYLYEVPGIMTSLNYSLPENSTWEIGINDNGGFDNSVKELAHRVEVTVNFKPIHKFLPETIKPDFLNSGGNIKQRFISLANSDADSDTTDLYSQGTKSGINLESNLIETPNESSNTSEQYSGGYRNMMYDVPTEGQVAAAAAVGFSNLDPNYTFPASNIDWRSATSEQIQALNILKQLNL